MKSDFDGFIRLGEAKIKISGLKHTSTESLQTKAENRDWKTKQNRISKCFENNKRCTIHVMGMPEGKERKGKNTWNNNDGEFPPN